MSEHTIDQRLADLETRMSILESQLAENRISSQIPEVVDRLGKKVDARVMEQGIDTATTTVGQVEATVLLRRGTSTLGWNEDNIEIERLFSADPEDLARGIAGLGHPARISLAKALVMGPKESATLLDIAGLNTTGQLYHHLQAMADVGLVERRGRNLWAGTNIGATVLLLSAGLLLRDWRGPEDSEEPA
jgi:hypothetical protein